MEMEITAGSAQLLTTGPQLLDLKIKTLESFVRFMEGGEDPEFPLGIYIEVSNVCNFKCAMCTIFSAVNELRISDTKSLNRGFIGFDDKFKKVAAQSLPHFLNVRAFGFGEPTIHPHFREILTFLSSQEVATSFFTNGSKVTPELADHIVDSNVIEVAISMSGSSAADYENVYIGGAYNQVRNAIRYLAAAKRKRGRKYPRILVNSLSYLHHLETFDSFVETVASDGANVIRMAPLVEFDKIPALQNHSHHFGTPELQSVLQKAKVIAQEKGVQLWITPELMELDSAQRARPNAPITEVKKIAEKMNFEGVAYEPRPVGSYVPAASDDFVADVMLKKETARQEKMWCPEPYRMMYWGQSGRVLACCHWKPTAVGLGDVNDASLTAIWKGPGYRSLREGVRRQQYPSDGCGDCMHMKMTPDPMDTSNIAWDYLDWHLDRFGHTPLQDLRARLQNTRGLREAFQRRSQNSVKPLSEISFQPRSWEELEKIVARGPKDPAFLNSLFEGYVDLVSETAVTGWARVPAADQLFVPLRLRHQDTVLSETLASIYRGDLLEAGKGSGRSGFHFDLSGSPIRSDDLKELRVEFGSLGIYLPGPARLPK